jgi:hypothetical protein
MKDFFVTYNKADKDWAEWVAWVLEEAGYSVVIQAWDFRPGNHFILEMHKAAQETLKTIAILSEDYLQAEFTQLEWANALARDPEGKERLLIPIRVKECKPQGLLKSINYVDLVNLTEQDARIAVLGAFSARVKPSKAPGFPPDKVNFPGPSDKAEASSMTDKIIETKGGEQMSTAQVKPELAAPTKADNTHLDRFKLVQDLSSITSQQFNMLIYAINPPPGIIAPMPAPQADRASMLLTWAEGPGGCSLVVLQQVLQKITGPP